MASVTIRNLPDNTHRSLKARAARNRRSTEAEIRNILEESVRSSGGIGSALAEIGQRLRGQLVEVQRDRTPVNPAKFD